MISRIVDTLLNTTRQRGPINWRSVIALVASLLLLPVTYAADPPWPTTYPLAGYNNWVCYDGMFSHSVLRIGACAFHGGLLLEVPCDKACRNANVGAAVGVGVIFGVVALSAILQNRKLKKDAKLSAASTTPFEQTKPAAIVIPFLGVIRSGLGRL